MDFVEDGSKVLNAEEIFDILESALRAQEATGRAVTVINLMGALEALKVKAAGLHWVHTRME
jgi:hypothetical protein